MVKGVGSLRPDALVLVLLAAWWVINLLQAAFTGLANDEAYYWYFSKHLDWGYFDHPPMVAVLVWLSSWLPGALGIRFCATLLQPLYLLLFWHLIRPADATRRDAVLYVLLCFSQPLLQLYGFLAVPDAPLMFCTVLFLWAWQRFLRSNTLADALLMGLAVALLGYSKYHGALVVLLVLLSQPRIFCRPRLYVAALVALVLYLPHLWWQYSHDWVSLRYHLAGRNAWEYKTSFTFEYLATLLVLFNPLWLYHYGRTFFSRRRATVPMRGTLVWMVAGFALFFLVATRNGHAQPQWLLPMALPLTALLFYEARSSRYVRVAAWVCGGLFLVVRVLAVTNPMGMKGELWNQEATYSQIAEVADGRPVLFMQNYTAPAKYAYYTGGTAFCSPYYFTRESQWRFDTADRAFHGREVVVGNMNNNGQSHSIELADGHVFNYDIVPDFVPMRELRVEHIDPIDIRLPWLQPADSSRQADSLPPFSFALRVYNPYSYDIVPSAERPIRINFWFHWEQHSAHSAMALLTDTLRAHACTEIHPQMYMPLQVPDGTHNSGFAIGYTFYPPASNTPVQRTTVVRDSVGLAVHGDW